LGSNWGTIKTKFNRRSSLRRLLVHFYLTHRHEKLSQQWRPWRKKGYCCFHGSFHRNPKRWSNGLLCKGRISHLSVQSVRNWAQASREKTAIINLFVFVVQFGCLPGIEKTEKRELQNWGWDL
jgi:hypothetical protein